MNFPQLCNLVRKRENTFFFRFSHPVSSLTLNFSEFFFLCTVSLRWSHVKTVFFFFFFFYLVRALDEQRHEVSLTSVHWLLPKISLGLERWLVVTVKWSRGRWRGDRWGAWALRILIGWPAALFLFPAVFGSLSSRHYALHRFLSQIMFILSIAGTTCRTTDWRFIPEKKWTTVTRKKKYVTGSRPNFGKSECVFRKPKNTVPIHKHPHNVCLYFVFIHYLFSSHYLRRNCVEDSLSVLWPKARTILGVKCSLSTSGMFFCCCFSIFFNYFFLH